MNNSAPLTDTVVSISQDIKASNRLISVNDWPKLHGEPSVRGLRHLIFFAKENGFYRVIRRAGTRIYLHEGAFFTWLESGDNIIQKRAKTDDLS